MKDFVPCRKCANGYIIKDEEAQMCSCYVDYQKKVTINLIVLNSNLPKSAIDYKVESYIGLDKNKNIDKLKKYIENYDSKFNKISLFVNGNNSTQKTTLISWLGKEVALKNFSIRYVLMNQLVKDLISYEREECAKEKVDLYNAIDLLIIDESFDLKKMTVYQSGYQISFLDNFLRERIELNKKSTIFISNTNLDSIDDKFGVSLKTLVKRNCVNLIFDDSVNILNNFEVKDLWN